MQNLRACMSHTLLGFLMVILPLLGRTQSITVSGTPASFCAPVLVTCAATGLPSGSYSYTWTFTPGSTATTPNASISFSFTTGGVYTVNCVATNTATNQTITLPPQNFTVKPGINGGFTITSPLGSPPQICAGQSITINNTSSGGTAPLSYNWAFGGGTGNNTGANNPGTVTFPSTLSAGLKNIQLVVTDALGCQAFVPAQQVQVNASPDASFTINQPNPCAGLVNFNSSNTTNGLTHSWTFGDTNTFSGTGTTTSHTYNTNSGQFTATLTITDPTTSCSSTSSTVVQIGQNPPSILSPTSGAVCAGNSLIFIGTEPPDNVLTWSFAGGTPSTGTGTTVTVAYNTPGTYQAIATLTNNVSGCIGTDTMTITVNSSPVINFTANQTVACTPAQANFSFTDNTPNASGWNWSFPGSVQGSSIQQNPSGISYSNPGSYNVTLTVLDASGCSGTLTMPGYIKVGGAEAGFTAVPPGGCVGQSVQLQASPTMNNATSIASYTWTSAPANSFSPNNTNPNPTVTYNTQGIKTVTLTITDNLGCTTSSNLQIQVGTPVSGLNFTVNPALACVSDPFAFTNITANMPNGAKTKWDYGDGAFSNSTLSLTSSHTYDTISCFTVTMSVDNNGCISTKTKTNILCTTGILALFDQDTTNGCDVPFSVVLNNQSSPNTSLQWNVNPYIGVSLSTTTGTNPTLTITTPGTYVVSLTATAGSGLCPTDSYTKTFTVGKPSANFTYSGATTLCAPTSPITPMITSANSSSTYTYSWGDGTANNYNSNNVTSASHVYSQAGIYNIKLIAVNTIGCTDTFTLPTPIVVGGITPTITVGSANSGCAPFTVSLQGGANPPPGINIVSWDWAIGNSSASGQNTNMVIDENGTFDINLIVLDNVGCPGFVILNDAIVVGKPVASFAPQFTTYCPQIPVTYVNNSTGTNLNYSWSFPNGSPSNVTGNFPTPPGVTYPSSPNPYTATVIVADALGCKDTATASVSVLELLATFTASDTIATCPPLKVLFDANTTPPHNIISYDWSFGSVVMTDTTHYEYGIPGDYDVTLIVTSDAGCKDTVTKSNLIHIDGPYATYTFSPKQGCPGTEVTFQLVSASDVDTFLWVFGDFALGDTTLYSSGITTASHIYTTSGTIKPTILVKNSTGCSRVQTPTDSLVIFQPPTPNFTANPNVICQSGSATLTSTSTQGDAPITAYSWITPNGTLTSATTDPTSVSYANIGNYDVTLIATDANGCKDTLTKTNAIFVVDNIKPNPSPTVSVSTISDTEVQIYYRKFPNPNNDFAEYRVYRDGTQVYNTTNIADTSYLDSGIDTRNANHSYEIEVVNACGTASDKSSPHTTIVLSTVAQNGGVQLNWTSYQGWNPQNYRLYRVTDYTTPTNLIATLAGNELTYTDTLVDCAASVSYRVEAVSANNLSVFSDTTQGSGVMTGTIQTPIHMKLATVVNNQFIKVSWENIPYIRRLKEIVIERNSGNGYQGIVSYSVGNFPNPLEYTDDQGINVQQQSYSYRVIGIDSCDQRTISGREAMSIWLNAQNMGGSILLNWTPYHDWVVGVDHYVVELYNENTQSYVQLGTVLPPYTMFIDDTVLFAQSQNCYRILAYEKEGNQLISESNQDCASPEAAIFSPTAFTPNGDNINDVFVMNGNFVKEFTMTIYDRWGKKVFVSNNINDGWDGRIDGKDAPEGVYTYTVKMIGHAEGSVWRERSGTITLIR